MVAKAETNSRAPPVIRNALFSYREMSAFCFDILDHEKLEKKQIELVENAFLCYLSPREYFLTFIPVKSDKLNKESDARFSVVTPILIVKHF